MTAPESPRRLLLATHNRGKLAELQAMLGELGVEVLGLDQYPSLPAVVEDGETFAVNALKKARAAAAATGLPALADDSGLEVDALDGAPGVFSARYGGPGLDDPGRAAYLLEQLAARGLERSAARFRCTVAIVRGRHEALCEAAWEGTVAGPPRGQNGFGYDPIFHPAGGAETAAMLPAAEKNRLSHRGQALAQLLELLRRRPVFLADAAG